MEKNDSIMDIIDYYIPKTKIEGQQAAEREYKRLTKKKDAKYNEKYKKLADKQPVKIMDNLKGYTKKKRPDNK